MRKSLATIVAEAVKLLYLMERQLFDSIGDVGFCDLGVWLGDDEEGGFLEDKSTSRYWACSKGTPSFIWGGL